MRLVPETVPSSSITPRDGQRPGPRVGLGLVLRRRRPPAPAAGEVREGEHEDAGPLEHHGLRAHDRNAEVVADARPARRPVAQPDQPVRGFPGVPPAEHPPVGRNLGDSEFGEKAVRDGQGFRHAGCGEFVDARY